MCGGNSGVAEACGELGTVCAASERMSDLPPKSKRMLSFQGDDVLVTPLASRPHSSGTFRVVEGSTWCVQVHRHAVHHAAPALVP